eukprot:m.672339 g.672339  ORF g.672339 m.672339 type:complete len:380 (-) comp22776_c1_seq41:3597-4736(-)
MGKPKSSRKSSHASSAASGVQHSAESLLEKAEDLVAQCNCELAVRFCDRVLESEPTHCGALECKAVACLQSNQLDVAEACLRQAIEVSPDAGASKYLYLAQLLQGQDSVAAYTGAIQVLQREIETAQRERDSAAETAAAREIAEAFCGIAELYMTDLCDEEVAQDTCVDCCERALQYDAQSAQAMQTMASVSMSSSQPEAALSWIQQSLAVWHAPTQMGAGGGSAAPSAATVDSGEGTTALERVPPFEFRINTAKILMELGQHPVAMEVLGQLLREDAEVVEVWYLLALAQHLHGPAGDDSTTAAAALPPVLVSLSRAKVCVLCLSALLGVQCVRVVSNTLLRGGTSERFTMQDPAHSLPVHTQCLARVNARRTLSLYT